MHIVQQPGSWLGPDDLLSSPMVLFGVPAQRGAKLSILPDSLLNLGRHGVSGFE